MCPVTGSNRDGIVLGFLIRKTIRRKIMKKVIAIAMLFLTTQGAYAAVDMFLAIDGVQGESTAKGHENEIDVLAWSWGTSSNSRQVCVQDVSVTKFVDQASPTLLMNQVEGVVYPSATLVVRKAGESPLEYIILEFRNLNVSSLSTGGSGGEDRLTENVTLNFGEVVYKYTPQKEDGRPDATIEATIRSSKCN
jgi:type VI secretion system secreted protein Hcp